MKSDIRQQLKELRRVISVNAGPVKVVFINDGDPAPEMAARDWLVTFVSPPLQILIAATEM